MRPFLREIAFTQVPFALTAFGVGCSLLVALFARSYFVFDSLEFVRGRAIWEVATKRGRLVFDNSPQIGLERQFMEEIDLQRQNYARGLPRIQEAFEDWMPDPLNDPKHPELRRMFLRFELLEKQVYRANLSSTPAASRSYAWGPPIAGITLLCLAAILACGYRTYRRLRLGQCTQCGYDLRASGDRCPECGKSRWIKP
jgi:hypothetical protein